MFTNRLPNDEDYRVVFSPYAERHFIKRFAKDYRGKQWIVTKDSIFQDLKRIYALTSSQQVDELKRGTDCVLFKYDFAVAQTRISPKASGNRCIVFLDVKRQLEIVLILYGKTDLPKDTSETQFVLKTVQAEFPELWQRLD